ncbi:ABC transporter permease [Advenella mimigardefordensis]|uniref:Putative ABC transporter permease protein n=1 Tax=Advenella mimigardefordensis (strain DSM 17166 / LMG 22922 / DPN7) TaxID=1247726 RepID=W0PJE0_ADVMD|nr:ABC transporter permease [Advenella mimigardefordensis]AHG66147.1 putative ABC transporter permease protein [Advenella mimigardefordensis DPN7]
MNKEPQSQSRTANANANANATATATAATSTVPPQRSGGFWLRLISLTRKEFRQLWRDASNLMIGIGLPIALILIFGYALTFDVRNARVAVVLEDSSPVAQNLVSSLELSDYFVPVKVTSMHEATEMMKNHESDAILRIPSDFARRLSVGDAEVQALLLGSDPTRASAVRSYLEGAIAIWGQKQASRSHSSASQGSVVIVDRMWFNAANNSTWYLVPGLISLIMTLVGTFLTALVMAREWERGTIEALFVTPVRPVEILIAKIIPYFFIGLLGLVMCVATARLLFDVPIYGSMGVLVLASMLYMFVSLGIGLLISAMTKNQFLASQVALLASFLPAMMLSGFIFDLRNVPTAVYVIGQLVPATYFLELVKSLFLAGNYWPLIMKNCGVLAVYAVVLLGLARFVTRKKLD